MVVSLQSKTNSRDCIVNCAKWLFPYNQRLIVGTAEETVQVGNHEDPAMLLVANKTQASTLITLLLGVVE